MWAAREVIAQYSTLISVAFARRRFAAGNSCVSPLTRLLLSGILQGQFSALGLGAGGWGLGAPGLHGPVVPWKVPQAVRPSKEAAGGAAQCSNRTTSPRFQ